MTGLIEKLRRRFRREKGSLVIESTLVYPVIFFVILFLLYMGNMYYLKAKIDSVVSQEAIRYAALYADPNLELFEQEEIPTTTKDTKLTDHLYRYVNFAEVGGFGKANDDEKDKLAKKLVDTGFFSKMEPVDIQVKKHEVNNYIIYQTYEVEVSYDLKMPIGVIFGGEIATLHMNTREEAPVTDTAEFIRTVDMAVDYAERSKSGEKFIASINEVYGRVDEFVNGKTYDPSEAVAGGVPGVGTKTGQEKIDYYAEGLITESGNVNSARLHQIGLDIQNGKVTSEEIKLLNKKVAELGITEEYEAEMKKIKFGEYLTKIKGPKPDGMDNAHAHHILYKVGKGPEQQALVDRGQTVLRKYGIDPIVGEENLIWAPNTSGQHVADTHLKPLVEELEAVEAKKGSYEEIVEVLQNHGKIAADWKKE